MSLPTGVSEDSLQVKFFNTGTNTWEALEIFERNTVLNYIIVNVSHFSTFAMIGTYTASSIPGGGSSSGGSGGGGIVTDEDFKNINNYEIKEVNFLAGREVRFDFNKVGAGIFYAIVTCKENEYDVTIRVENLKGQPKKATTPAPNTVYLYTNILSGSQRSQRMVSAKIGFKVSNTWFDSNNIDKSTVKMYRLQDGNWNVMDTKLISSDGTNTTYEAITTGFSKFAITGEVPAVVVATPVLTPLAPTSTPEEIIVPEKATIPTVTTKTTGFDIMFGMIGMLSAIYIMRKRR